MILHYTISFQILGKTENWWTTEMNSQLKEKFHIEKDLDAVFIDSWAKQDWNLDDFIQQEAFTRETTKLWNLFSSYSTFEFKTIQGNNNLKFLFSCNALKTFLHCKCLQANDRQTNVLKCYF